MRTGSTPDRLTRRCGTRSSPTRTTACGERPGSHPCRCTTSASGRFSGAFSGTLRRGIVTASSELQFGLSTPGPTCAGGQTVRGSAAFSILTGCVSPASGRSPSEVRLLRVLPTGPEGARHRPLLYRARLPARRTPNAVACREAVPDHRRGFARTVPAGRVHHPEGSGRPLDRLHQRRRPPEHAGRLGIAAGVSPHPDSAPARVGVRRRGQGLGRASTPRDRRTRKPRVRADRAPGVLAIRCRCRPAPDTR